MLIKPGLTVELKHLVTEQDTAITYGSGLVPVLSTPFLIALMENVSQTAINALLEPGQTTVGTSVDMKHIAATPIGMEVHIRTELVEVHGRRLHFHIEAWDQIEKVGECEHERFIIDKARFMKRVSEKLKVS